MVLFIRKLITEHSHLIVQFNFLLDALERIQLNGYSKDDFTIVKKIINYLNDELILHNKLEEEQIFSKTKTHNELRKLTTTLTAEHRIIWDKLEILIEQLTQYEKTTSNESFSQLYRTSISLNELIKSHIQKENEQLFTCIETSLTKEDLNELCKLF